MLNAGFNAESFIWSTGETSQKITVDKPGIYSVEYNRCGNDALFSIDVSFDDCNCTPSFPNIFSPNSDALNDVFEVNSSCPLFNYNLAIFNRWGQKIFESNDMMKGWNGQYKDQESPPDVYIYYLKYSVFQEGVLVPLKLSGDVTIVR